MNSFRGGAIAAGVVVLVLVMVGLALLQRTGGGDDVGATPTVQPIDPAEVRLTAIQRAVFDANVKYIYLDVAYEPKEQRGPILVCAAEDSTAKRGESSPSSWSIIGEGQVRVGINMAEAPDGRYDVVCQSGTTQARASVELKHLPAETPEPGAPTATPASTGTPPRQ